MTPVSEYRPAKLQPVMSPTELRERTVRDYATNARRAGLPVSSADLDRLAVHDLEMVDSYNKGVDRSPRLPKAAAKAGRKRKEMPDDLPYKAAPAQRDPGLDVSLAKFSARWPFAMGRMKRILEGAQPHRDPVMVAMSCEIPELAIELLRLHRNYLMRGRESRHNPFAGLSEIDARRAMVRLVEDICDRSSGRMGPWWVPK